MKERIIKELENINESINLAYQEGYEFDEFVNLLGINKPVLKCRLKDLGYQWIELKHDMNENSIEKYFNTLDESFEPFPKTFAEDVYELLGETDITKRYCKERNILTKEYRYTIEDEDGSIKYVKKSKHPLYNVWNIKRAITGNTSYEPQEHHKKAYKGVEMYKPWVDDFDLFYDDMLRIGWYKGCHISRKGDIGNYEPNNIEILTASENIKAAHPGLNIKMINVETGEEYYFNSLNEASQVLGLNAGSLSLKLKGTHVYAEYNIELLQ